MKGYKNLLLISVCALAALIMFAGCSDYGSGVPLAPEEQTITIKKVAGLTLFRNGHVVAIIDQAGVQGNVTAQMNKNSDIFEVEFFDENGEVLNGDAKQYKLAWNNDTEYATFELHSDWEFFIYGKKTGQTTFQLQLKNGGSVDYSSPAIPLEVK
ncbi:MAG: hypothetical protein JSW07_18305 [bacterium]|nr:MAG: hypothetical protein JSW07_18305 [bacterium]